MCVQRCGVWLWQRSKTGKKRTSSRWQPRLLKFCTLVGSYKYQFCRNWGILEMLSYTTACTLWQAVIYTEVRWLDWIAISNALVCVLSIWLGNHNRYKLPLVRQHTHCATRVCGMYSASHGGNRASHAQQKHVTNTCWILPQLTVTFWDTITPICQNCWWWGLLINLVAVVQYVLKVHCV